MSSICSEVLLIDIQEVARLLGVSVKTARRMDSRGKLPLSITPCKTKRWRLEEVKRWVNAGCPGRLKWENMRSIN